MLTASIHIITPFLNKSIPYDAVKDFARANLARRLDWLDNQLASRSYLMGEQFTVADAYLFVMLQWCPRFGIDLELYPNIDDYEHRIADRPAVQAALAAEGLLERHRYRRSA